MLHAEGPSGRMAVEGEDEDEDEEGGKSEAI